jgi:hypothetical protein
MSTLESTPPGVLDVAGYAAAVRRSLADLGREQVDDLTDGLEADLADALADTEHVRHGGDLVAQFGAPQAYAAELRSAAGLEPGAVTTDPKRPGESMVLLGRLVTRTAGQVHGWLEARSWWPGAVTVATTLRPLWWVVRGWVAYQVAVMWWAPRGSSTSWIPESTGGRIVLLLAVVASLVLGGAQSWRTGGRRVVVVLLDVCAMLALVVAAGSVHSHVTQTQREANAWMSRGGRTVVQVPTTRPENGVVVGGIPVSNLFVYDAEGNPLKDVQIYDDRGRPVRTTYDNGVVPYSFLTTSEPWYFQSRTGVDGRSMWNVYPLLGAPTTSYTFTSELPKLKPDAKLLSPPAPFAKAPAVLALTEQENSARSAAPTP